MTWTLSTAVFVWLGILADGRWDMEPIFTLSGAFIGVAAGFYYYYMHHQLVTLPERPRERRRQEDEDRGEAER